MPGPIRWQSLLTITLVLFAFAADANAEKTFRWKVQPGDQFDVVLDQTLKQTMKVAGQTINVGTDLQMTMKWEVQGVEKDHFLMDQTITRINMKMSGPGLDDVVYDSDARKELTGVAAQISSAFQPMIDVAIKQEMNLQGKVLSVDIPDKALEGIQRNPLLNSLFSEEAMSEMMRKVSPELPADAIEKDHQWKQSSTNLLPVGAMIVESTYKYVGEEQVDGAAVDVFDVVAKMEFKKDEKAVGPLSPTIDIEKQKLLGKIYFDNEKGRVVKTTADQSFDMKVKVGQQEMSQSMTSDLVLTVTPTKPSSDQ